MKDHISDLDKFLQFAKFKPSKIEKKIQPAARGYRKNVNIFFRIDQR